MNPLMPPPQRNLSEADRREIHAALVRTSHAAAPRPRRRTLVLVPALALTSAAAVVCLNLPGAGLPITGVPVPAGPVPTATPDQTAGSSMIPAAQPIDRGPLISSVVKKIVTECLRGLPGAPTVDQVHFARRTSINGGVVLLTDSTGMSHICTDHSTPPPRPWPAVRATNRHAPPPADANPSCSRPGST